MRSKNNPNQNESAANSSPTDGKSRLSLASCALVAVFALATAAAGAQRMDLSGGLEGASASRIGDEAVHGYGLATVVRQPVPRAVGAPRASEGRYVPAEVLVQLAPNVPDRAIAALARRLRLDRIASATAGDVTVLRWRIPDQRSVPAVIHSLEAERIVLAAQPNYLYSPQQEVPAQPSRQAWAPR